MNIGVRSHHNTQQLLPLVSRALPRQTTMMRATTLSALVGVAAGHGSMIMPASRNSIDATLPAWYELSNRLLLELAGAAGCPALRPA